jgi:hypothetical protein
MVGLLCVSVVTLINVVVIINISDKIIYIHIRYLDLRAASITYAAKHSRWTIGLDP